MIGVIASASDLAIAAEFFELFKTPWEPAVAGRKYRAVLSTNGDASDVDAGAFLLYGSETHAADRLPDVAVERMSGPVSVEWGITAFPSMELRSLSIRATMTQLPSEPEIGRSPIAAGRQKQSSGVSFTDLFFEAQHLLTVGQPAEHAETPTLDLHVTSSDAFYSTPECRSLKSLRARTVTISCVVLRTISTLLAFGVTCSTAPSRGLSRARRIGTLAESSSRSSTVH